MMRIDDADNRSAAIRRTMKKQSFFQKKYKQSLALFVKIEYDCTVLDHQRIECKELDGQAFWFVYSFYNSIKG